MLNYYLQEQARYLKPSATLQINEKMRALRAEGRALSHFGFGESPFFVHPLIQAALSDNAHQKSYLPAQGLPQLREAVAHFYVQKMNLPTEPAQVIIGPGSKELLFILFSILEGPLLLPAPRWVSYAPQAQLARKQIIDIPTRFEAGYLLETDRFEQCLKTLPPTQQKILLLNSPNNPTGAVYTQAQLQALVELARKHQVLIISDEIYAQVTFPEHQFCSVGSLYPEGAIVTGGLSKDRSLGGYRLGVAVLPAQAKQMMQVAVAMATETFSCVAAPVQYAACAAYAPHSEIEFYVQQCTLLHAKVLNYTHQRLQEMGLRCLAPQGGFYVFPDFMPFQRAFQKFGIQDDLGLGDVLLDEVGIAVLPGQHFGVSPQQYAFRLSPVDYDGQAFYAGVLAESQLSDRALIQKYCPRVQRGLDALADYVASL